METETSEQQKDITRNFDYINRTYGVSAKNGDRVRLTNGAMGMIVGAEEGKLEVLIDGASRIHYYHPEDKNLHYIDSEVM